MDEQEKQVAAKLKEARNVLVTVSANPSVDQLSACLGLTLMLNKLGKHAAAVFSGEVPSTLEFLKPEATLEGNTDSLRDFIISLDRAKADKLRYKVEDKVVKIFITPYKTSINQDDLEFSEGEFNVDVVVALGVKDQQDIDQAVVAHGNILHDATVITITTSDESALGTIHWRDPEASGVSELVASLAGDLGEKSLDEQVATAMLTGIVARTERFSNNLTSSHTMTVAASLMSAGADQQLVATKLETVPEPTKSAVSAEPVTEQARQLAVEKPVERENDPGLLEIEHDKDEPAPEAEAVKPAEVEPVGGANDKLGEELSLPPLDSPAFEPPSQVVPDVKPEISRLPETPETPTAVIPDSKETVNDIEASVHSPHVEQPPTPVVGLAGVADQTQPQTITIPKADSVVEDGTLPSIHVDENGMLVHQPNSNLKPAPGFETGHHLLGSTPDDPSSKPNGDEPPPVPPPIV